ncbi:MAG: DNA repair protein RecO [Candidatus Doudnabacteria bacterium]|nr:DNA repair protein RecO [Candidatus Doudnabacteria bacterium]
MRYDSLVDAFILKQQPLGEADVLGTWFTRELGKVRGVVVGGRRPQSRLSAALLPGTILKIRLVARHDKGLFTVAGTRDARVIISEFTEVQTWVYVWALEAITKAVPDVEQNLSLYSAVEFLFARIAHMQQGEEVFTILQFLVTLLDILGIAPQEAYSQDGRRWFDLGGGGFVTQPVQYGAVPVMPVVYDRYVQMRSHVHTGAREVDAELVRLLEQVLEHYLERPLHSFSFVNAIL